MKAGSFLSLIFGSIFAVKQMRGLLPYIGHSAIHVSIISRTNYSCNSSNNIPLYVQPIIGDHSAGTSKSLSVTCIAGVFPYEAIASSTVMPFSYNELQLLKLDCVI